MSRTQLVENIRETLTKAGYYVSELCLIRPISFDLVARRDNSLLIIKVLTNVDALSEDVANELKVLSNLLKGSPILIGERSGLGLLEIDAVYDRFGIQTINPETLKNHLLEGMQLKVYAAPGGFYVNLDTDRLIKLRNQKNYSLGSFARSVRVSRRTVRMYETGMNARVEVASRIEEVLDESVTIPIDIIKPKLSRQQGQQKLKVNKTDNEKIKNFQNEIFSLLQEVGYKIIPMGRGPFEAVSKEKDKILLTCVQKYDNKLEKKAQIVSSISKITEKHAVLFTDKNVTKTSIGGTPLIIKKELKKIKDPEVIIELILERVS